MEYKYARAPQDYSDLASGRVLYSLPGHPAFPVRLASEIFQRCVASRERVYHVSTACTLYDPCCGAAYLLSVLVCLHAENLREVIGSDISETAVALARKNLGLLNVAGIEKRIAEISRMLDQYQKDSHREALASAHLLKNRIVSIAQTQPLPTKVFEASASDRERLLRNIKPGSVDIVLTDVPYGHHSEWQGSDSRDASNPIKSMLDALRGVLSSSSIVAIASDKKQKVSHADFQRVEQFQIGKRRVVLLKPV